MLFVSCICHAFASVHCCLVVTCWKWADLLALVGDAYCIFVTFPCGILSQVWYLIVSFLIFAIFLTFKISFLLLFFCCCFWPFVVNDLFTQERYRFFIPAFFFRQKGMLIWYQRWSVVRPSCFLLSIFSLTVRHSNFKLCT